MPKRLGVGLSCKEIEAWLREENEAKLELLWQSADLVRELTIGPEISLRGLVELSNHCVRKCTYCGINALSKGNIERYRMSEEEIFAAIEDITQCRYGTVVLQAGEDYGLSTAFVTEIIRKIKAKTKYHV